MNITVITSTVVLIAFAVNITVQMLKELIPIPTKLLCLIMSVVANVVVAIWLGIDGQIPLHFGTVGVAIIGSPMTAFIAMYGFETFKELWTRFEKGGDINEFEETDSDEK